MKPRRVLVCHECNDPHAYCSDYPESYPRAVPGQTIRDFTVKGMKTWVEAGIRPLIPTSLWGCSNEFYEELEQEIGSVVSRGVKNWRPEAPLSETLNSPEMKTLVDEGVLQSKLFWMDNESHYQWRSRVKPTLVNESTKIKDAIHRIQDQAGCRFYLWCPHLLPVNNIAFDDYLTFTRELEGLDSVFVTPYRGFGPDHLQSLRWRTTEDAMDAIVPKEKQVPIAYLRMNGRWPAGTPGNPEFDVWSPAGLKNAPALTFGLNTLRTPLQTSALERWNPVILYPGDDLKKTGESVKRAGTIGRAIPCLN